MPMRFFDTTAVDAFAAEVAREVRKALPPEASGAPSRVGRRSQQLGDKLERMLDQFARSHTLNIYQKAKFGPRLQDALAAQGFDMEFAQAFSYELVKRLALARGR